MVVFNLSLVSSYLAAFVLSPCGAVSLGGMFLMESHFPPDLVRWVVIFCGSGMKVFSFPFGFSLSVMCGLLLEPCLLGGGCLVYVGKRWYNGCEGGCSCLSVDVGCRE